MANRTVSVKLVAEVGQYVAGMSQASAATVRLGDSAAAGSKKAEGGFGLAGKGALIAGGAVVAGLGMAVSKSMEFESAMSGAAAATRVTGGALQDLRDAAMDAGARTQYSATEAAQAITEMGKAGVSTADILGGGLDGALALAAAGQLEVATAAEIASVAMTQFKLSGDQLPHVADLLAAGAGKAMGSVEDLGMALNQAGLVASASGLSIEETTGTLAAFASAGLVGSDAGTSLKTMLQKLQAPSKEAAGLMADLGINLYDANGNFAGMDSLAGQLKGSMAKLTPATRDAAMATIFGSDAVRAANVLYSEGATGIADWTAKVNDAGYAAETAAALNDNLKGDLERLGGAFDTLMIQMGSGAQGPLRDFVQMLTAVVDAGGDLFGILSSIPTPVYVMVAALAAAHLLGGPLQTAFKGVGFAIDVMSAAARNSGGPVAALKSGLGGIPSMLGGPWGIAMMAATAGIAALASNSAEAKIEIDKWSQSLRDGGKAAAELQAAVERQASAGFMTKLKQAFTFDDEHNISEDFKEAQKATEDYYQSLDPVAEAQARVSQWSSTLSYRLETLGKNHEDTRTAQERLAYWTEVLEGRQGRLEGATEGTNGAMEKAKVVVSDFAGAASAADSAISNLQAALDELSGKTVTMFEAESQLGAAIDAAKGALDNKTGSVLNADGALDAYSESGRAAGDVLLGVRDKGNQLIATMIQQGASAADVAKADADLRASFIKTAGQMGIEEGAANALADQILGIPSERQTRVDAQVAEAKAQIADLQAQVNALKDKSITISATVVQYGDFRPRAGVNVAAASGGAIVGGRLQHFDIGGAVRGPGGPTADRVPAMLSNGEHVWTSAEVNAAGGQAAVAALRRSVLSGREFSGGSGGSGGGDVHGLATQIASILASRPTVGTIVTQRNETGYELADKLMFEARTSV